MVSLVGKTGPYLQYAAARMKSLLRRAVEQGHRPRQVPLVAGNHAERVLMLKLLGFGEVVEHVGVVYEPHRLCGYLYDLAQAFTSFYDQCPVLAADTPDIRDARLALCAVTLAVLERGLSLLGITAPDRM
jgi:arginyl-tRNA synthetase